MFAIRCILNTSSQHSYLIGNSSLISPGEHNILYVFSKSFFKFNCFFLKPSKIIMSEKYNTIQEEISNLKVTLNNIENTKISRILTLDY